MKGLLLGFLLCTVIVGSDRKLNNRMRRKGLLLKSTLPAIPTRTTLKTALFRREYDFDFEGTHLYYDSEAEDGKTKNAKNGRRKREIAKDYVNKAPIQVDNRLRLSRSNTKQEQETDKHHRSLRSGDYFTVQELLPVTQKLTAKVEHPGEGKGIVSSAGSPEQLAERLFRAFFNTEKQIVVLKDYDISALDALQALALNDDEVPNVYDKDAGIIVVRDDLLNDAIPFKAAESRFKLLSKLDDEIHAEDNVKPKERKAYKKVSSKPSSVVSTSKAPVCRWRYKCTNAADLSTCELFTQCDKSRPAAAIRRYHEKSGQDDKEKLAAKFRKMMKFTILDEEVEKILEGRFLSLRAKKQESPERQANLRDYFKTLNMIQHSTTQKARLALDDDDNIYDKDYVQKLEDAVSKKTDRRQNINKKKVDKIIKEMRQLQEIQGRVKIRAPQVATKPIPSEKLSFK